MYNLNFYLENILSNVCDIIKKYPFILLCTFLNQFSYEYYHIYLANIIKITIYIHILNIQLFVKIFFINLIS